MLPAETAATPEVRPVTSTGVLRCVFVPSPSWPTLLRPQHLTPPAVVSAQVWKSPAETAATPPVRPVTSTGVLRCVFVPSPSWPLPLNPQHLTPPAVVRAQMWLPLAETAATPEVRPVTSTGVLRCVFVPSPSWPVLLSPQHFTPPAVVRAQVWSPPAETAATPEVRPVTSTGVLRCVFVPSPSSPKKLFPQHLRPPAVVRAQVWRPPAETIASGSPVAEAGSGPDWPQASMITSAKNARTPPRSSPHFQCARIVVSFGIVIVMVICISSSFRYAPTVIRLLDLPS